MIILSKQLEIEKGYTGLIEKLVGYDWYLVLKFFTKYQVILRGYVTCAFMMRKIVIKFKLCDPLKPEREV